MDFFERKMLSDDAFKRMLEVGSMDLNGTVRMIAEVFHPSEYIGIDLEPGKCVDLVLDVKDIVEKFGENSFDVVICSEMLEHVEYWRTAVNNMKRVLKPGGHIYITTRSYGFGYHAYPEDYWRYSREDVWKMFSDSKINCLEDDTEYPGVFLKATKPEDWKPKDLSRINVFSMQ